MARAGSSEGRRSEVHGDGRVRRKVAGHPEVAKEHREAVSVGNGESAEVG